MDAINLQVDELMEFLKILEGIRTPVGDFFFLICTYGGEEIMLLSLVCILFWCVDKKLAYRMTFAYLPSALAVDIIKLSCRVERPWVRDPSITVVEAAKKTADGYSFPSGHTQNATSLFGTLGYVNKKTLRVILWLLIPLVMFSRMYLGVHTPTDVFASFTLSVVIVSAINLIADRVQFDHKKRLICAAFLLPFAIGTIIYTYVLYSSGMIAYKDAADSFKGCGGGLGFIICWILETRYVNFDVKCSSTGKQVLKLVIGLAGILILKEGIKHSFNALIGPSFFTDVFRYLLMMFWAMFIMPVIIKKYFQEKPENKING